MIFLIERMGLLSEAAALLSSPPPVVVKSTSNASPLSSSFFAGGWRLLRIVVASWDGRACLSILLNFALQVGAAAASYNAMLLTAQLVGSVLDGTTTGAALSLFLASLVCYVIVGITQICSASLGEQARISARMALVAAAHRRYFMSCVPYWLASGIPVVQSDGSQSRGHRGAHHSVFHRFGKRLGLCFSSAAPEVINERTSTTVDTADQRMTQDVDALTSAAGRIVFGCYDSPGGIVASITSLALSASFVTSIFGSALIPLLCTGFLVVNAVITTAVAVPAAAATYASEAAMGRLRYRYAGIADAAEAISWWRGQPAERSRAASALSRYFSASSRLIAWDWARDSWSGFTASAPYILNYAFIAALVWAQGPGSLATTSSSSSSNNSLDPTALSVACAAIASLLSALNVLPSLWSSVANLAGYVARVDELLTAMGEDGPRGIDSADTASRGTQLAGGGDGTLDRPLIDMENGHQSSPTGKADDPASSRISVCSGAVSTSSSNGSLIIDNVSVSLPTSSATEADRGQNREGYGASAPSADNALLAPTSSSPPPSSSSPEQQLLRGVSFTVPPGQSVHISAPSGCGKTSLLRALAGLWPGQMQRRGVAINDVGSFESDTGVRPSAQLSFVPCPSYHPIGTLAQVLGYPSGPTASYSGDADQSPGQQQQQQQQAPNQPLLSILLQSQVAAAADSGAQLQLLVQRYSAVSLAGRGYLTYNPPSLPDSAPVSTCNIRCLSGLIGFPLQTGHDRGRGSRRYGTLSAAADNDDADIGVATKHRMVHALQAVQLSDALLLGYSSSAIRENIDGGYQPSGSDSRPSFCSESDKKDLESVRKWDEELSRGQAQRLALARLLLQRPQFAFLDEATSGLDAAAEAACYAALREAGITCVSVAHGASVASHHSASIDLRQWAVRSQTAAVDTTTAGDELSSASGLASIDQVVRLTPALSPAANKPQHGATSSENIVLATPMSDSSSTGDAIAAQLDGRFFKQLWTLLKTAVFDSNGTSTRKSRGLLSRLSNPHSRLPLALYAAAALGIALGMSQITVRVAYLPGAVFTALQNGDLPQAALALAAAVTWYLASPALGAGARACGSMVGLRWYVRLVRHLSALWLAPATDASASTSAADAIRGGCPPLYAMHYDAHSKAVRRSEASSKQPPVQSSHSGTATTTDRPDQRIIGDAQQLTSAVSTLLFGGGGRLSLIQVLVTIGSTTAAALSAGHGPLPVLSCYAFTAASLLLSHWLVAPVPTAVALVELAEGAFRSVHTRVRRHAEAIAFLRGERYEGAFAATGLTAVAAAACGWVAAEFPPCLLNSVVSQTGTALAYGAAAFVALSASSSAPDAGSLYALVSLLVSLNLYLCALPDYLTHVAEVAGYTHRVGGFLDQLQRTREVLRVQAAAANAAVCAAAASAVHDKLAGGIDTVAMVAACSIAIPASLAYDRSDASGTVIAAAPRFSFPLCSTSSSSLPGCTSMRCCITLLTAPSGAGKTSLLRSLAGLWPAAAAPAPQPANDIDDGAAKDAPLPPGVILMMAARGSTAISTAADSGGSRVAFVPSDPRILDGPSCLLEQLVYPHALEEVLAEAEAAAGYSSFASPCSAPSLLLSAHAALCAVGLGHLCSPDEEEVEDDKATRQQQQIPLPSDCHHHRYRGLLALRDWSRRLSTGEGQRLALARLLLLQQRPQLAFLDEATSGLDAAAEAACLAALRAAGIALVVVSHRLEGRMRN